MLIGASGLLMLCGCRTPAGRPAGDAMQRLNQRHAQLYGDFDLPGKIGYVENVGLQLPVISPNGEQILYLRTDRDFLSPMTLLGSPDPQHTPAEGVLSIWIRPVRGTSPGRQLSAERWAHSPIWSASGRAIAYVVNEPPHSFIVHLDLAGGEQAALGLPNAINCLPRFDGDDRTLLFCAAGDKSEPFRVYRQIVGQAEPVALSPAGVECLFPIVSDLYAHVLCARVEADHLNWVKCNIDGVSEIAQDCGSAERPAMLQTWAGIASPLSPDRRAFLFYDTSQDRICVCHADQRIVQRHRPYSIAACWLDNDAIALATRQGVFIVNTTTGMSISLFNGQWIPIGYVPATQQLVLLGGDRPSRFSIVQVTFRARDLELEG